MICYHYLVEFMYKLQEILFFHVYRKKIPIDKFLYYSLWYKYKNRIKAGKIIVRLFEQIWERRFLIRKNMLMYNLCIDICCNNPLEVWYQVKGTYTNDVLALHLNGRKNAYNLMQVVCLTWCLDLDDMYIYPGNSHNSQTSQFCKIF